jgi:hypothetical protein
MKRFFIIGAMAGVAVCVLLACTSVSTMAEGKDRRYMVIKIDAATGDVTVTDEKGGKIDKLDCEKAGEILADKRPIEYVGTILYTHKSPGCIFWTDMLGFVYMKCWP